MRKYIGWVLAIVLLSAGIYFFRKLDWSVFSQISIGSIALLIGIKIISVPFYAYAVKVLLGGMGYDVSLKNVYLVVTGAGTASFISNLKLGLPVRIVFYRSLLNIPTSIGTAAMSLETAIWVSVMAVVVAFPVPELWGSGAWSLTLFVGLIMIAAAIGFLAIGIIMDRMPERIFGFHTASAVKVVANLRSAFKRIDRRSLLIVVIVITIYYGSDSLLLVISLNDLGWSTSIFKLVYVNLLSYLAGVFSFSPMGLGTQDLSLVFLLRQLGAPENTAVAVSIIVRIVRVGVMIPLNLISLQILGVSKIRGWVGDAAEKP